MATTTLLSLFAVAVIAMCSGGAIAQAPRSSPGPSSAVLPPAPYVGISPGPYLAISPDAMGPTPESSDCFNYVLNMSDCLSYVQEGSNLTVPDKPCCPELAGLLESHPLCLCQLLGSAGTYGVNVTKALALPPACGLPSLPLSLCPGAPAGSPAGSTAGSPEGSGETGSGEESPTGSIAVPPNSRGASTISGSSSLVFLLVLAISFLRAHL